MSYPPSVNETAALARLAASTVDTFTDPATAYVEAFPDALNDVATACQVAEDAAAASIAAAASAATLIGTSVTSLALSTGSKTFVTQSGKDFAAGRVLRASSDANPSTNWMDILITSYSGTSLQGTVLDFAGSGTLTDWTIRVIGQPGQSGGYIYLWSTAHDASDPGSGKLKADNATLASSTGFYISETDFNGNSLASVLTKWDDSTSTIRGRMRAVQITNRANYFEIDITGTLTDNGSWDTFAGSNATSGGTIADGAMLTLSFIPKGDAGTAGSPGTNGTDGITLGNKYTFNSATSGDPATGKFLFNNATFASATAMNIYETDGSSAAIATMLTKLDDGTSTNKSIVYFKTSDGAKGFSLYITGTLTDNGTYDTFSITPIQSWGTPANNDVMYMSWSATGDAGSTGATGPTIAPTWVYSTTTTASDPGSNAVRFNNATAASITACYIDNNGQDGTSIATLIDTWDDSTNTTHRADLHVVQTDDQTKFADFVVGTIADSTGYRTMNLTFVAGPGGFGNGKTLAFSVSRTGNRGADGAGSGDFIGPASAVAHNLVAFADTTGKLGEDSGILTSNVVTLAGSQTLTNKTLTAPKLADGGFIADSGGNEAIVSHTTASAVNQLAVTNAATGTNPKLSAEGDDSNVGMDLQAKGTGKYRFLATSSGPTVVQLFEDTDNGTNSIALTVASSIASDVTLTLPSATDTLVGKATTDTLTNKRVTERVGSETSSATPTINTDNEDIHRITALAVAITSVTTNLSGTPTHGQKLIVEITGTATRAITWGSSFEASTVALPTTTSSTTMLMVGFMWNSATSKWRCVAVA